MTFENHTLTAELPSFLRPVAADDLVRIGSPHDGGYVVSQRMLEDAQFLLSFGLGENWAFEAAICDCLPARTPVCHAYDGSTSRQMPTGVGRDDLIARYEALFDGNRALHFKQNVSLKNDKKPFR